MGRRKDFIPLLIITILTAGIAWIWLSRTEPGETTSGEIPAPQTGFLAPDFSLNTPDGHTIRLYSLRGQPVIVNVWASWCVPCRLEMPAMERVYRDYKDRGLNILAVNSTSQDQVSQATAFAESNNLSFPILLDEQGEMVKQYLVNALPTSFMIDKDGIIQEVVIGGPMSEVSLRVRVERLLEEQRMAVP
jgi:peroxiredoxin